MGPLVERQPYVDALGSYALEAAAGDGRFVMLAGEAGIGKTSLLDAFRETYPQLQWLWGSCDGTFTPQPLGPLYEIAGKVGGRLLDLCADDADRRELFNEFLAFLGCCDGPVVVVEDLHWADEATLDWLLHLARRVARTRTLVVVSYRDDEVAEHKNLRAAISQIVTHRSTRRLSLPPLSEDGVRRLAGSGATDIDELYRVTGGNPFYVTEVIEAGLHEVPSTVADVVAARSTRLTADAQGLLAAASVLARPSDATQIAAVAGGAPDALDECLISGALVADSEHYQFRHELTRMAVERSIPNFRRSQLHRAALKVLETAAGPPDPARLAHHAEAAGETDATLRYAAAAAAHAAAYRSNREAIAQYQRALRFADLAPPEVRASLLEGLSRALALRDNWEEAAVHCEQALALRLVLDDIEKISEDLRLYFRCLWRLCRGDEAAKAIGDSFALMADAPESVEKGWAYSYRSAYGDIDPDRALKLGLEALRLGELFDDERLISSAHAAIGYQRFCRDDDGWADMQASLEVAVRAGDDEGAARGYANLYQIAVDRMRMAQYEWCFTDGMRFCRDTDMKTFTVCLRGSRATALMRMGRLEEAAQLSLRTLPENMSPINRLHLLIPFSVSRLRQGEAEGLALLEETRSLARATDETDWLLQVATAYAQAAWLTGDLGLVDEEIESIYQRRDRADVWLRGELAVWLHRIGRSPRPPDHVPSPYALELADDNTAAAAIWQQLGCPYEEAAALHFAGDPSSLRRAHDLFIALGAIPGAALARQALRNAGERSVPRGPHRATRANLHGLTPREAEVFELVRDRLTNAEISRRLFISQRTVEHHVASALAKLNLSTRLDATRGGDQLQH